MIRQRIADVILPWASAHASVWPSQHATHAELWDELSSAHRERDEWRQAHDRVAEQLAACIEDYNAVKGD